MRVLGSIVGTKSSIVPGGETDGAERSPVELQPVRPDTRRRKALPLEPLLHQPLGRPGAASGLDQEVQHPAPLSTPRSASNDSTSRYDIVNLA